MKKQYYYSIDIVKVICAVFIICIHTSPLSDLSEPLNSLLVNCICRIAVPFFFISSGFFLFLKCGTENPKTDIVKNYLKRILLLYLIWSAVYFPFTALQMVFPKDGETALSVFLNWLKNMVFSAGFGFLWYLPATVVAVLIVTVLLKIGININKVILIGLILYCIGLCGQSYFGLVRMIPFNESFLRIISSAYNIIGTTRNGIFEGIVFIALGAKLSQKENTGTFKKNVLYLAISVCLLTAEFIFVGKMKWHLEYDMYLFLIPAAYFLLCSALCSTKPFTSVRLKYIRPYSSLIYFIHMLPIEIYCIFTRLPHTNSFAMFFIALIPTLILSSAIIFISEKNHFKFLKKLY